MKLLAHVLCLCLALTLACARPHKPHSSGVPDRCKDFEIDSATANEEGIPYFFKGDYMFKGFRGKAELINETFPELEVHLHLHQDHVDVAFLMRHEESDHDHMVLFLGKEVFNFYQNKLEDGYPKNISEVFPGIPDDVSAAVECPKSQCDEDEIIFFSGHDIYHFDLKTKAVDKKEFKTMPNCTAAFRFMEHYYCFHGHTFSKFDPKTGEVHGKYPKESRGFFVRCSNFSEHSDHVERERCSRVRLDAITSDNAGNVYAFRGHHFIRKDAGNDTLKADTIEHAFKGLHEVDDVFTYEDSLYIIKGDSVYAYKVGEPHTLLDGYPKTVKEELGIEGHIDAAFVCNDHHIAHIIKDHHIYDVELKASPRVAANERPLSLFKHIDTAMCDSEGVKAFVGTHYYQFASTMLFVVGKALPEQHKISVDLFGCDH